MHTIQYRRWAPPQSHIGIEFPSGLLSEIRLQAEQDRERGVLFGSARMAAAVGSSRVGASEIRIVTANRDPESPQVFGMEPVGVYVCRARGEVFLTDDDLAYMDQFQTSIALVIAGGRAGFFVRQSNGTLQAVRSYEEFTFDDATSGSQQPEGTQNLVRTENAPRAAARPPAPSRIPAAKTPWRALWKPGLFLLILLAIPIGAIVYLRPLLSGRPIAISLKQEGRQLIASWDPSIASEGGRLEITDAGVRTTIEVIPGAARAVYQRHPPSQIGKPAFQETITVRLNAGKRTGTAQWSAPYLDLPVRHPATPRAVTAQDPKITRQQVAELEQEVRKLRMVEASRNAQIMDLSKLTEQLQSSRQSVKSSPQLAQWYKASMNARPALQ